MYHRPERVSQGQGQGETERRSEPISVGDGMGEEDSRVRFSPTAAHYIAEVEGARFPHHHTTPSS
jgi:hypothetical protein